MGGTTTTSKGRAITFMAVVLALTACSGDSGDDAEQAAGEAPGDVSDAIENVIDLRVKGQHGRAWDLLVPQQQALISRTDFISCGGTDTGGAELRSVDVEETYAEEVAIPGTDETVDTTAITVNLDYRLGDEDLTETATMHLVDVDGTWRWILAEESLTACGV